MLVFFRGAEQWGMDTGRQEGSVGEAEGMEGEICKLHKIVKTFGQKCTQS